MYKKAITVYFKRDITLLMLVGGSGCSNPNSQIYDSRRCQLGCLVSAAGVLGDCLKTQVY